MTDKNIKEIINTVKSQLNGDREHDREIIKQAMDDNQDRPDSQEIIHELSRMLTNYLTEDEIEQFDKALEKDLPEYSLLNSVEENITNQQFEKAFNKLDNYMTSDFKRFVNDENIEYHVFNNYIEEKLFEKYCTVKKEIRIIPFNLPIFMLYHYYGYFLVEQNRLDEAENSLKIALEYNPISLQVLFELIDLYKIKGDWNSMYEYLQLAFKYAYTPDALARAYRDLGYYYVEVGKPEISVGLYIHSLKFEQTEQAFQELEYLKHIGQNIDITPEDAKKLLHDNDIPLVANPFIVEHYRNSGDIFGEEENMEQALEMYALAYVLDDSLENQMRYKLAEAVVNGTGNVNITL